MGSTQDRLHALDAVRAIALLVGIAAFLTGVPAAAWTTADASPSRTLGVLAFVTHLFGVSLFFFLAGFFACRLFETHGARGFWGNRLKRILVPLLIGWAVTFPLLALVGSAGLEKVLGAAAMAAPSVPTSTPFGWFPIGNLWFLYVLLQLYVCVLVARWAIVAIDANGSFRSRVDGVVRGLLNGYWAPFALGIPLAACLYATSNWSYLAGIPAPDQTFLPKLTPLVGYGTALACGWLVQRQRSALESIQRRWPGHLVIAVAASVAAALIMEQRPSQLAIAAGERLVFVACFTIALWGWVIGLTGLALDKLAGFSSARRYLADSSYWLYIAHLPVLAAMGAWAGRWNLQRSIEYPFVLVSSLALLLVSYHFLVRRLFTSRQAAMPVSAEAVAPSAGAEVAELMRASKSYGTTLALDDVTLQVKRGELLAVLGPNGAGKSTAIAIWLGLTEPDTGHASLMGGMPSDIDCRRRVGVMMQEVEVQKQLRVRELIALTASYYRNPMTVEETLELTHVADLADRVYSKLSGGQKRKVQFALAVCGRPELLFLDEPTAGLDVPARQAMWATIQDLLVSGCSIVLTTHYLEEAEALADRVVVLAKSRVIASGSVAEMRALVSRRQIHCDSRTSAEEIRSWPGVIEVIRDEQRLHITVIDAEDVVRRLLAADSTLRNLEVRQAGLNEAFAQLTKEAA